MEFRKRLIGVSFTVLFIFMPSFLGAVNISQIINLKQDGSGTMTFTYMEKDNIVKENNFMIGNLPFDKEKIEEYFKTSGAYIQQSELEKNEKDSSLEQVVVNLAFKDITKLGEAKAFANMFFSLNQTDSGNVYRCTINEDFVKTNSVNQIYFILKPDSKVLSSNGKVTDKDASIFIGKDFINGKSEINFIATLESGVKNNEITEDGKEEEKEKVCGLIGFEFPIVILFGSLFYFKRKNKSCI